MKHKLHLSVLFVVCISLIFFSRAEAQSPLGTGFTYQGYLAIDGVPVTGNCDFQFSLWDALSSGAQIGSTVPKDNVMVTDGIFTVTLDFGSGAFNGEARWLGVAVRCPAGSGSYTTLNPYKELSASPYALYSQSVPWGGLSGVPFVIGDLSGTYPYLTVTALQGKAVSSTAPSDGEVLKWSGSAWTPSAFDADTLDGQHASAFADAGHNHDLAYWKLGGNAGTLPGTDYIGTSDNQALEIKVNGQRVMRLEPNAISPNIINGYNGNWITSGVYGAVLSGGGSIFNLNRVTDVYGVVIGGANNQAGDGAGTILDKDYAVVVGGTLNTASGAASDIGGGYSNTASGYCSSISGGYVNLGSGDRSFIGGGDTNVASGMYSVVPGGYHNTAAGLASFAAGLRARAYNNGSFVWADSNNGDFASTADNQFNVRAFGGVRFVTNGVGATIDGNKIWHAGNDGTGSTLDADYLDGQHASAFSTTSHNHDTSYWKLTGNAGTTPGINYIGTNDNVAFEIKVNGTRVMRFEPTLYAPNLNAGYLGNLMAAGVEGSVIAGGGFPGLENLITDSYSVISGGAFNKAGDDDANSVDDVNITVAGGYHNQATASYATISGGRENTASGDTSTVAGGGYNYSVGAYSMAAGGYNNRASADYSFAAGYNAVANRQGAFVWADTSDANFYSYSDNSFNARAVGGFYFFTSSDLTSGVFVPAGGNAWSSVSDHNMKDNFAGVNGEQLLENLAAIPISTWNYKSQDESIRHIGPMAQDFYVAFNVGEDNLHISTIDADGVALAGVQALYAENLALKERIEKLEAGQGGVGATKESYLWNILTIATCAAISLVVSRRRK